MLGARSLFGPSHLHEAALALGVSPAPIRRRLASGELPATTLAHLTGHSDAGFTLKVYARDARDEAAVVSDVLDRAAGAGIGS